MTDINRLVIFLLLAGLLYALYKYQHLIFAAFPQSQIVQKQPHKIKPKKCHRITVENISQASIKSLEDEKEENIYKQDSILGSLGTDSNETAMSELNSLFDDVSNGSNNSKDSLFF
jgi:hypothetical protein